MNSLFKWSSKHSLIEYIFKNSEKVIAWILAPLFISTLFYFDWSPWKWEEINPVSMPPFIRMILSVFVYWTFWAFLYFIRFYQLLYKLLPRKEFKEIKTIIWIILIWFTYLTVIPFLVSIANFIITIWYNLLTLILYITPPIFFAILIWWLIYLYKKYKKN